MIRRLLRAALRPLACIVLRRIAIGDPWQRIDYSAPLQTFGSGARHDFAWYFEGESAVAVGSLEDVQAWLAGCAYAHDPHLFQEPDFWQHPRTFEQLRRGDCEDFALWAWRKLVELGYDADLVVGRRAPRAEPGTEPRRGHAWIVFRRGGEEFLFEPVWQDHPQAIRPLAAVKGEYIPAVGVGPDRKRFTYTGYLLSLRDALDRTRRRPGGRRRGRAAPSGPTSPRPSPPA